MNARDHAETAAHLAERAQSENDNGAPAEFWKPHAELAQVHALTAIALQLVEMQDRVMAREGM